MRSSVKSVLRSLTSGAASSMPTSAPANGCSGALRTIRSLARIGAYRGSPSTWTKAILTCCCGEVGEPGAGASWAAAVEIKARTKSGLRMAGRHLDEPTSALIIDHNAPRHATDRDRNDCLAACRIDDRDVVAESVGHVEGFFVTRQRDAP